MILHILIFISINKTLNKVIIYQIKSITAFWEFWCGRIRFWRKVMNKIRLFDITRAVVFFFFNLLLVGVSLKPRSTEDRSNFYFYHTEVISIASIIKIHCFLMLWVVRCIRRKWAKIYNRNYNYFSV